MREETEINFSSSLENYHSDRTRLRLKVVVKVEGLLVSRFPHFLRKR